MRIYEFSKKYNRSNKEIIAALQDGGFEAQSHMSVISENEIKFLKKQFNIEDGSALVAKKDEPTVIIKKIEKDKLVQLDNDLIEDDLSITAAPTIVPLGKKIIAKPTLLGDLADEIGLPASQLILFLLKQGIVCNRNQVLTVKAIASIATEFGLELIEPIGASAKDDQKQAVLGEQNRLPVVVVIGHVDHGKTTLLDFIRKTRVAAREKGGITQHLGAYRVDGSRGSAVFLDTPGHEAFVGIRQRGLKVADIAILIVAADDGVMPQTIEAIRQAKAADLPVIVAINKIDRANEAQIEKVKLQLSQQGLTAEEWGGDTIMVKVSAKTGEGVDELIDMIILQSEMMELRTNLHIPSCGYVLEAKTEKGRGPVATFIAQHGTLKVGEFFACGETIGKVVSLKNCAGENVLNAGPSVPVSISGFEAMPKAGDYLRVVSEAEYRQLKQDGAVKSFTNSLSQSEVMKSEAKIKLLLKSDTSSSGEAVVDSIKKLIKKTGENILIVGSEVGDINERDVSYADSVGAQIFGFGVKINVAAAAMAKGVGVAVHLFGIIYQLTEHLEDFLEKNKPVQVVKKRVGEAEVRKIFDIKGVGVIAGIYVKSGKLVRGALAVVLRHGKKVHEGTISSLQSDRKSMKEIVAGHEGAFIIEGYTDWVELDMVECFIEERVS